MAEIKVGDKYKGNVGGHIYEVTAIGRTRALVVLMDDDELSVALADLKSGRSFTKIEPFFEKGKTYRAKEDGPRFEVDHVSEKHGMRVAWGFVFYPGNERGFPEVREYFGGYEEVKESE